MYTLDDLGKDCYKIASEILPRHVNCEITSNKIFITDDCAWNDSEGFRIRITIQDDAIRITHFYMCQERKGYGSTIMEKILKYCKDNSISKIYVWAANKKAQNFFGNKFNFKIESQKGNQANLYLNI